MKLSELILKREAVEYGATGNEEITQIGTAVDSPGGVLLVITGDSAERHLRDDAPRPAAILCGTQVTVRENIPCIKVENVRAAAAYACARLWSYRNGEMLMVGVTGTNGKTGTARFLQKALGAGGYKVGFIGTGAIEAPEKCLSDRYYSMTTPDPWVLFPALSEFKASGCSAVVMEVSSHALALDKVTPIEFDYGIFLNLTPEHLDFHKDMEEYFAAKKRLLDSSRTAVINLDDPYGRRLYKESWKNSISVGVLWRGDVYATHVEDGGFSGVEYMYHGKNFNFTMRLKTAGVHNVYNSMLATAVAADIGVRPCVIKEALADMNGICGRFEIIKDRITVIIDYAHTDKAMEALLSEIRKYTPSSVRLHTVFGCGGERDKSKRPRMAAVAERYSDLITVTSDNPRREDPGQIITQILAGFTGDTHKVIEDRAEAITNAIVNAEDGDIVVLVGKGAERYSIDKSGYREFDERKIVRAALEARRNES